MEGRIRRGILEDIVMSEWTKILLTSGITVVGGVLVFVVGRIIERFFVETIYDLRVMIKDVAYSLAYYAGEISNPGMCQPERMGKAADSLRILGTQLPATAQSIPFYAFWSVLKIIPQLDDLYQSAKLLISISNTICVPYDERIFYTIMQQNAKAKEEISRMLCLGRRI